MTTTDTPPPPIPQDVIDMTTDIEAAVGLPSQIKLLGLSAAVWLRGWEAGRAATPPDRTKAAGSLIGQCGHTPWPAHTGEGHPAALKPPVCHLGYGHVGMHSDGDATWTRDA